MKKFLAALFLVASFITVSPAIAAPTPAEMLAQAQTLLATDPAAAADMFQQAAAGSGSMTPEQLAGATGIIQSFLDWASNPTNQTGNPNAVSNIFTAALVLSGTPGVSTTNPNLYAAVLAAAQDFANKGPKDNQRIAELSDFLQLAVGGNTPTTNGLGATTPTDD